MYNPIGFIVNGVVEGETGPYHAMGRCGDQPIRVGDVFDVVHQPMHAAAVGAGELSDARTVHLRVERIQAYQRTLEELGSGMTGTLDLCGRGLEFVASGCVLGSATTFGRAMEQVTGKAADTD